MIRVFSLSRAALPADSSTLAARYSITAAKYTGAPAPTRRAQHSCLNAATDEYGQPGTLNHHFWSETLPLTSLYIRIIIDPSDIIIGVFES